jgi:diguanylate cyclase (GGDEF)-like protein
VPVIYISARDDAKARLSAVRGCGRAYLTKPVDVSLLVEWLDTLTERSLEAPYKVLLVDDNGNLCHHHALFLEQAGLITRICNKAIDMLDILRDFNPDVVLLDMYMPEYQGQELAMMIRQLDNYSSLPIVYLSTENMERVQLEAMLQGGDDFLTKPINPEILIRVINYRAMRYRQIRSLMTRDSLTRLLNHRHIKETLAYEINRAKREENACSLLMIDIDFFKQVNDTHGHSTGDQVLKTISRFLRQRLRTTDIIGRYGGEEFACVLPNTTTESAYLVATDLCRNFASIEHHGPESSFHLTFSCGIASYPDYVTAEELSEAADQALYSAKRNGRNRVEVAAI